MENRTAISQKEKLHLTIASKVAWFAFLVLGLGYLLTALFIS
jgi:hypothetical protein